MLSVTVELNTKIVIFASRELYPGLHGSPYPQVSHEPYCETSCFRNIIGCVGRAIVDDENVIGQGRCGDFIEQCSNRAGFVVAGNYD